MNRWTLYPGPGRVSDAASPDVRGRSYTITARVRVAAGDVGVLVAHGDRHAGYALRLGDGALIHDYAHAGVRTTTIAKVVLPVGRWLELEARVQRVEEQGALTLLVDGQVVGRGLLPALARSRTGYTGVDVGCDRGLPVGSYDAPARFTGDLARVVVVAEDDQWLDLASVWEVEGATG